jgi:glycosyltransferase involved in cell wall biosynthesis
MSIILCVSNDLTADQRVHKMALTLMEIDDAVLVIGRKRRNSKALERRAYKTIRLKLFFEKSALFYAELNIRLFFYLLFHPFKVAVANDADTIPAVYWASKLKNKKRVFDSHEIFSEVPELIDRPFIKKVWQTIENYYIPKFKNSITVCQSIAEYYNDKYQVPFIVIPNYPLNQTVELKSRSYFQLPEEKQILLYQGVLNKARGIELMIESLNYLPDWILVIVGIGDIEIELKDQAKKNVNNSHIFFLGQLDFESLKSLTRLADVGLSLEEDYGLNYRFALPNKLFDYLHAEIPVVVSDLPEMSRLVHEFQVGVVANNRSPEKIAELVNFVYQMKLKKEWNFHIKDVISQLFWSINQKKLHNIYKPLIL